MKKFRISFDDLKGYGKYFGQELKDLAKDKRKLLTAICLPAIISVSIYLFIAASRPRPIQVAVAKNSDVSNPIYKALENNENIVLIKDKPYPEVRTEMEKGKIDAMVDIQKTNNVQAPFYKVDLITSKNSKYSSVFMSTYKEAENKVNSAFASASSKPAIETAQTETQK
jgi:ABC-type Na+ efflux pump permease subunit